MSKLNASISLELGDTPTIVKHCDHHDGTTSWAVLADDGIFYFWATAPQMTAFAHAILQVVKAEQEKAVTV